MNWNRVITVVGAHAEGECGNVVTGGIVDVPGETMFDKKRHLEQHGDGLRKFLLFELRGGPIRRLLHPTSPYELSMIESKLKGVPAFNLVLPLAGRSGTRSYAFWPLYGRPK